VACLSHWQSCAPNSTRCPTCKTPYRIRRGKLQRFLTHPTTIASFTAGASLLYFVSPTLMLAGLESFVSRLPLLPARARASSPRQRIMLMLVVRLALALSTMSLYNRAARNADFRRNFMRRSPIPSVVLALTGSRLVVPVVQRHGRLAGLAVVMLSFGPLVVPAIHAVVGDAIRARLATSSSERVLDTNEL